MTSNFDLSKKRTTLESKLNFLKQVNRWTSEYAANFESLFRPEDAPRVFVVDKGRFQRTLQDIRKWRAVAGNIEQVQEAREKWERAKVEIINPVVRGERIERIRCGAVADTFFRDNGNLFLPSKYYGLYGVDPSVILKIQHMASQACGRNVKFDKACKRYEFGTNDPMTLESPDTSDPNQLYFGDTVMFPSLNPKNPKNLRIQLFNLTL